MSPERRQVALTRMVHLRPVPLLTPEEMDTATKKSIDYQPPGSAAR
jgi:hypothetical protein